MWPKSAPWDDLVRVFGRICANKKARVFIVLDALDECPSESNRKLVLALIRKSSAKGARICVTGRDFAADIHAELENKAQIPVMTDQDDVRNTLDMKMKERRITRKITKSLREEIIRTILEKSQGM